MNGQEHYREAERLLTAASRADVDGDHYDRRSSEDLVAAEVHAILALVTAVGSGGDASGGADRPFPAGPATP